MWLRRLALVASLALSSVFIIATPARAGERYCSTDIAGDKVAHIYNDDIAVCMGTVRNTVLLRPGPGGTVAADTYGLWWNWPEHGAEHPGIYITHHDYTTCTVYWPAPLNCRTFENHWSGRGSPEPNTYPEVTDNGRTATRRMKGGTMGAMIEERATIVYNPQSGRHDAVRWSYTLHATIRAVVSLDLYTSSFMAGGTYQAPGSEDRLGVAPGPRISSGLTTYPAKDAPEWFNFWARGRNLRIERDSMTPRPTTIYTTDHPPSYRYASDTLGAIYDRVQLESGRKYEFGLTYMPFVSDAPAPAPTMDYELALTAPTTIRSAREPVPAEVSVRNIASYPIDQLKVDVSAASNADGHSLKIAASGHQGVLLTIPTLAPGESYQTTVPFEPASFSTEQTYQLSASAFREPPLVIGPTVTAEVVVPGGGPYYVAFGDSVTTGFSVEECGVNREANVNGCLGWNPGVPYPKYVGHLMGDTYWDLRRVGIWGDTLREAAANARAGANAPGRGSPWTPQLNVIDEATGAVTGSLGINDLNFSGDFMKWISLSLKRPGGRAVYEEAERMLDALDADWELLFDKLEAARLRGVKVATNNYYNPFADSVSCEITHFTAEALLAAINLKISDHAQRAGIPVADFYSAMRGHGAGVFHNTDPSGTWVYANTCSAAKVLASDVPGWTIDDLMPPDLYDNIGVTFDPHPNRYGSFAFAEAYKAVLS